MFGSFAVKKAIKTMFANLFLPSGEKISGEIVF